MGELTRLRIDLAYDGAPFFGFARQTDHPTVQGVLEDALLRLLGGRTVETTCAGRTDRGVHAAVQIVHVDVPSDWRFVADLPQLRYALDRLVGEAITINRVRAVPRSFDARFSAVGRRYRYRLWDRQAMPPLLRHDTWHVGAKLGGVALDVQAMEEAGQALVGEHDYTSFCRKRWLTAPDGEPVLATMMRRIDTLTVRRSQSTGLVLVRVEGKAFCHTMVRSITGSLVEVGADRRPVCWVGEVLAARDRSAAGPVAPPQGLSLVGVQY